MIVAIYDGILYMIMMMHMVILLLLEEANYFGLK
jgi:hypothetical protein